MPEKQRRDERHAIRHQGTADVHPVTAKTASYSILEDDIGTTFTNRGDTDAITFTLPVVTNLPVGWWCCVNAVDAFDVAVISEGSSDNIVVLADKTADSVKWSTSGEIIGAGAKFLWDGTGWLVQGLNTWDNGTIVTTTTVA
jgi:hypothetical protein